MFLIVTSYLAVPSDLCIIPDFSRAKYAACWLLRASFLLGVLVSPEDIDNMFLSNVG
jgi:hypothetical protein